MQPQEGVGGTQTVLDHLVGRDCAFCDTGNLATGEFKGTDAVICTACETPAARVW